MPRLNEIDANPDRLGGLAGQLPAEGKSALAALINGALPELEGNPPPRAAAKDVDIGDLGGVALGTWRSMRTRSTMPCWRCYA